MMLVVIWVACLWLWRPQRDKVSSKLLQRSAKSFSPERPFQCFRPQASNMKSLWIQRAEEVSAKTGMK